MTTKAHGKKYLEAAKLVDSDKLYAPQEAISLLKKLNYVKFDPTVEIHMKLGVDPRHADQMVRGVAMLPAGTGKEVKVLVFTQGEKIAEAEAAGADPASELRLGSDCGARSVTARFSVKMGTVHLEGKARGPKQRIALRC